MSSRMPVHTVLRRALMSAAIVVATATSFVPAEADAAVTSGVVGTVSGTLPNGTQLATQAISGVFNITRFATQTINGVQRLVAIGTLTTTVNGVTQVIADIVVPVTNINGTCPILHLDLGPVDLTVLGLNVHLNEVVLDITATPGAGNLLGNLLCTVAGLLDQNPANLQRIVGLLNNLLNNL